MPIVPRVTPDVAGAPLPARPQPLETGAGARALGRAQGLGALAEHVIEFAQLRAAAEREADGIAVTEALGALSRATTQIASEIEQRRGRDAIGSADAATEMLRHAAEPIRARLANPRQAQAFGAALVAREAELYRVMLRREDDEITRWSDETTEASVTLATERASALGGADRGVIDGVLAEIAALRAAQSKRSGWDAATLDARLLVDTSTLHAKILDSFADGDYAAAQAYYDAARDDMLATDRLRVEAWLEKAGVTTRADREADRLVSEAGTDRDAAYRGAAAHSGPLRREIEAALDARYARQERLAAEAIESAWEDAQTAFRAAGYRLAGVPAKIRSRLPATGAYSEEALLLSERNWHAPPAADHAAEALDGLALYARWANMTDAEKRLVDPVIMFGRTAQPSLLRHAIDERALLLNPSQRGLTFAAVRARAIDAASALGVFRNMSGDREQQSKGALAAFLAAHLEGREDDKGNYSPDDVARAIDAALVEGKIRGTGWIDTITGGLFGARGRAFERGAGERFVPSDPPADTEASTTRLVDEGFPAYFARLRALDPSVPEDPDGGAFHWRAMYRAGAGPQRQPDGSLRYPEAFRRAVDAASADTMPPGLRASFARALEAEGLIATDAAIEQAYRDWLADGNGP